MPAVPTVTSPLLRDSHTKASPFCGGQEEEEEEDGGYEPDAQPSRQ